MATEERTLSHADRGALLGYSSSSSRTALTFGHPSNQVPSLDVSSELSSLSTSNVLSRFSLSTGAVEV